MRRRTPLTEERVRERAVEALAQEIRLMLDEGVVQAVQDIDLCVILGAGWPSWLRGSSAYLDRTGVSERVTGSRFLPRGVAGVPARPADLTTRSPVTAWSSAELAGEALPGPLDAVLLPDTGDHVLA